MSETRHDASSVSGSETVAAIPAHDASGARAQREGPHRSEDLLPIMYHELRSLARARLRGATESHTLQPTALVHEAYLRLTKSSTEVSWNSPGHFFGAAAEAMRQVLVDHARAKASKKRGGDRGRVEIDDQVLAVDRNLDDVLLVSEAVDALEEEDPVLATILKLRYFVGLGREEAAAALGMPLRTFERRWRYVVARMKELSGPESSSESAANAGESRSIS